VAERPPTSYRSEANLLRTRIRSARAGLLARRYRRRRNGFKNRILQTYHDAGRDLNSWSSKIARKPRGQPRQVSPLSLDRIETQDFESIGRLRRPRRRCHGLPYQTPNMVDAWRPELNDSPRISWASQRDRKRGHSRLALIKASIQPAQVPVPIDAATRNVRRQHPSAVRTSLRDRVGGPEYVTRMATPRLDSEVEWSVLPREPRPRRRLPKIGIPPKKPNGCIGGRRFRLRFGTSRAGSDGCESSCSKFRLLEESDVSR
jgi:hypothetical protein